MADKSTGFTLIELAVVLFIVGLLLAGLFTPVATSIDRERRQKLEREYEQIEEALIGFVIINGRFPCPDCPDAATGGCVDGDEDDGGEDVDMGTGTCKVGMGDQVEGNLPWAALGVTGRDPWGRRLAYQVQHDHADDIDGTGRLECSTRTGVSFQICSSVVNSIGITVKDTCGGGDTGAIAQNVLAVVYSQGNHLATSCNELENTNGDKFFVSRDYSTDETSYYDDMIFWISPQVLVTKMVDAEILP